MVFLALVSFTPVSVRADDDPVDLELGGEGAVSWDIGDIQPGSSGTKTVTLHNSGYEGGSVTIWISDIVAGEGTNPESETGDTAEPGELDGYLLFGLSCSRLSTNLSLPTTIEGLPQSPADPSHIEVSPLNAGKTVTVVWEWEFPETGEPQNDAQGDSLSFTINYALEQLPSGGGGDSGGGGSSYQWLEIDILGEVTMAKLSSSGRFLHTYVASDPTGRHSLEFTKGTRVTCDGGKVPRRIEMTPSQETFSVPAGTTMVAEAYELTGCGARSRPCSVSLNKPATLTLSYDPVRLPENVSSVFIAFHDEEGNWIELACPPNSAAEHAQVSALVSHTSTYGILADLRLLRQVLPPPDHLPLVPAAFEVADLIITPTETEVPGPVTISVGITNTGELRGSYELVLTIDGETEAIREISLGGGESTRVSFTVAENEPGTYVVVIATVTGEFTVTVPQPSPAWIVTYWWLLLVAALVIALICFLTRELRRSP